MRALLPPGCSYSDVELETLRDQIQSIAAVAVDLYQDRARLPLSGVGRRRPRIVNGSAYGVGRGFGCASAEVRRAA
jgi:hypothetical protein